MFEVIRGEPGAEELAAVLAVLWALAAAPTSASVSVDRAGDGDRGGDGDAAARLSPWRRSGLPSGPQRPGPGAWRMSAWTR